MEKRNLKLENKQSKKLFKKSLSYKKTRQSTNGDINKKSFSNLNMDEIEKKYLHNNIQNIQNKEIKKIINNKNLKIKDEEKKSYKSKSQNKHYFYNFDNDYNNIIKNIFSKKENSIYFNKKDNEKNNNLNEYNENNKKIFNSNSLNNNKTFNNDNGFNNNKYDLLLSDYDILKSENKLLKEKIYIFLKLIRTYSIKLKCLSNLIFKLKKSFEESDSYKELISTIDKLNELVNNPKLNKNIFKKKMITSEETIGN